MNEKYMLSALRQEKGPVFTDGSGAWLYDEKGRKYLELNEICVILGVKHPRFTARMIEAVSGVDTLRGDNPYRERLADLLISSTNNDFSTVHLTSSGSEAVEWAVKTAAKLTGRHETVAFWNSIHGRTHLSSSLSGMPRRKTGYGPLSQGIVYSFYPACANCPINCKKESCGFACLDFLDKKIKYESSQDVGALIIEPYQGSCLEYPPEGFMKALRAWTEERGILMIMDEIQSGLGRTGQMYRYQYENIVPDMLLLGKGLGNGFHISALLMRERLEKRDLSALAGGSGDNSIACAAACAVMDELTGHGLVDNVKNVGLFLANRLKDISEQTGAISAVRGSGLAVAVEFVSAQVCRGVQDAMKEQRIFIGLANERTIFLKPPLWLTETDAEYFCKALDGALTHME